MGEKGLSPNGTEFDVDEAYKKDYITVNERIEAIEKLELKWLAEHGYKKETQHGKGH